MSTCRHHLQVAGVTQCWAFASSIGGQPRFSSVQRMKGREPSHVDPGLHHLPLSNELGVHSHKETPEEWPEGVTCDPRDVD